MTAIGVRREVLLGTCNALLQPERFKDYGPNGLQVEGRAEVHRLVSGVTASRALIEAAIDAQADAILVHHGLFWRGQSGVVTGWMKQRLQRLLAHDINLLAYHLPLDAHPELGNNAQLGWQLGLRARSTFGEQALGMLGSFAPEHAITDLKVLTDAVSDRLGRRALCVAGDGRAIRNVAWCTGGAQGYFEEAIAAGADVYLTGEISEPQAHLARETGVAFLACGHHATERYGAPAVGAYVAAQLGLSHQFIDIDNPA